MTEFKPVVFKVGNEYYGVDINLVRGIEKMIQVVSIPNSNPNIKGIINLRGDVIPVYSLREKFNLEPMNESEENQFIIVKVDDMLLALEVDKVDEIQNISEEMIFDVPIIIICYGKTHHIIYNSYRLCYKFLICFYIFILKLCLHIFFYCDKILCMENNCVCQTYI